MRENLINFFLLLLEKLLIVDTIAAIKSSLITFFICFKEETALM